MQILIIAFIIVVMAVAALSVSKSRALDTVLFCVFYSAVVVAVTATVIEFLLRLS